MTDGEGLHSMLAAADGVLPCGRPVDELLEQAADGRAGDLDPHQSGCVHCQSALREFSRLWTPVLDLAAEPVAAPAELARQVIEHIRRLVDNVWYTMHVTELGVIRVAARIVAAIARDAARAVPGVEAALGRSTLDRRLAKIVQAATRAHRRPNAAVGVLGKTASVDLAIAVTYGQPIPATAREVQRRVGEALRETIGLTDVSVNVTVDDIRPPSDGSRR